MTDAVDYRIRFAGRCGAADVRCVVVRSTRDVAGDGAIDDPWRREKQRLGDKLFDGPMCRYEGHDVTDGRLTLRVSRTSYKAFLITNLFGPRDLPSERRANPIGVSATLACGDGVLLFGRRGDGVAYYPRRLHPFAGSLEWPSDGGDVDVFAECRRELREELSLQAEEVPELAVVGIVEDVDLRHPEIVLHAATPLPWREVAGRLDPAEHNGVEPVPATVEAVAAAASDERFTPVARASMQLWLRAQR